MTRKPSRWSVALLALFLTATFGCAIGPVWARRLEGRVVHAETGEPVADAAVFQHYVVKGGDLIYNFDHRWTTTDEDGHFAIPGHIALTAGPPFTWTKDLPSVQVVHGGLKTIKLFTWEQDPDHPRAFPGWRQLELALEPGKSAYAFESTAHWAALCSGFSDEACDRICEVAYGSVEACYEQGMPR